ncbi:MAG: hypothetical protein RR740_00730 [Pseudomonas sp.]
MTLKLQVGEQTLPCREVVVAEQTFNVPRGIARNARNRAWQVKVKRAGALKASGNFTDDTYNGTEEALTAAISYMAEALAGEAIPVTQNLKISQRVSLIWTTVGPGVLGISATVYDPNVKKGTVIYLISQKKVAAGRTDDLKGKLVKALSKELMQESGQESMTLGDMVAVTKKANELLASPEWTEFLELGVKMAADAREEVDA